MPERVDSTNRVRILSNEYIVPTDGQRNYDGPGEVRIHEFPEANAVQVQTDDNRKLEITGIGTVEEFLDVVGIKK